jgi:response regulator NasT
MPGPDGLAASEVIMRDAPTPIVILTAYADSDSIARALDAGVSYYLVKPIDAGQLEPAILMAEAKFRELMELRGQVASLEDALEQRKILDRAKGILMREMGVDEPGAHQLLQRLSSQMRKPVKDVAAEVIKANGKTFGSMKDE